MGEATSLHALTAEIGPAEYVVTATGELDADSAPELRDELDRLVREGARVLVLDLRRLTYLDSTGVGVVSRAAEHASECGGDLVLASSSRRLVVALEQAVLSARMTIRPSLGEAIDIARERAA